MRAALRRLLAGDEYPGARAVLERLCSFCVREKLTCPSRATLYKLMEREAGRSYEMTTLPPAVQAALYNLHATASRVPGPQLVIGGHAVRCFCPYRPSCDVDFGVREPRDLAALIAQLQHSGEVELVEQSEDTVHLRWAGINVSIFVLDKIGEFVEERRLSVTGILATKLHAILDRGTRRDFFDLYVTLQHHRLGIAECLEAIQRVYRQPVNQSLLLRALTYFDDAEREAHLPGEGPRDWRTVKEFFTRRVGDLLVPPGRKLAIQSRRVDVIGE